jgi:hypothetical protein
LSLSRCTLPYQFDARLGDFGALLSDLDALLSHFGAMLNDFPHCRKRLGVGTVTATGGSVTSRFSQSLRRAVQSLQRDAQ